MKKLFFTVACTCCVADLFAMNSVKRFCSCVGGKVACFVPPSTCGKIVEGGLFVGTIYGLYKVINLKSQIHETNRAFSTMNFPNDWQKQIAEYNTQIFGLSQTLTEEKSKNELLNQTINDLNRTVDDLNQTIENLRNGESTLVEFDNSNDETPVRNRGVLLPPPPASPMAFDDNSSANISLDLNSSFSVSSLHIPEGEEAINLQFDGFRYKGQGHNQEPQGKGEVASVASSSFKIEGFFQDQKLVISDEYPVCFKSGGTRFSFSVSEQCQPIVFELNDFMQFRLAYIKQQNNYLIHITNGNDDNFIFRPAYLYKGQVDEKNHVPEGNGVMFMAQEGSILEGKFKGEKLIEAAEKFLQQEPLTEPNKEEEEEV